MYEKIKAQAKETIEEILSQCSLKPGDVFVVGCSSSTVKGEGYGQASSMDIASAIFESIYPELQKRGIILAAQCCEHLNRAIITSSQAAKAQGLEIVNVLPQPKAGGSFATLTYENLEDPVAVEHIKADAGMDIGGVLIGMHLREVAVPLNLKNNSIGLARVTAARTRPKFIGGDRAHYNEDLK